MMFSEHAHLLYSPALRYFVAIARMGSIRGAARELNVVSSAVNRQLLNLEKSLSILLFDRVGRGLKLSQAGEILLRHAQKTLLDFDTAISELDNMKGLQSGVVHVATVESVADSVLPMILSSFHALYPGIQFTVEVGSASDVLKAVTMSECHIALSFDPPNSKDIKAISHFSMPVGAVVAPHHPLAKQTSCTIEECIAYPCLLPSRKLAIGEAAHALIEASEVEANWLIESTSLRFMRQMALSGNHVAFQSLLGIEKERTSGDLVFIPLHPENIATTSLTLMVNASSKLALAPKAFLTHSEDMLSQYLSGD